MAATLLIGVARDGCIQVQKFGALIDKVQADDLHEWITDASRTLTDSCANTHLLAPFAAIVNACARARAPPSFRH